MEKHGSKWILWAGIAVTALLAVVIVSRLSYLEWTQRKTYFHADFERNSDGQPRQAGWQAFGGTWQAVNGAMQNIADDRGAKLMNGNTSWHNYMVEADIQLLAETGDAGFVIRSTDEEVGVDSYHGYFAGLRDLDDTLIIGRADYGWHEFRATPVHPGVYKRTWYHLKVIAFECILGASATTEQGETTTASVRDPGCIRKGRFGLQSYSAGALWRNVELRAATETDLRAMIGDQAPAAPNETSSIPALTDLQAYQRNSEPIQRELRDHQADLHALPIASLRLLPVNVFSQVTVHGVVTLVSPILFVQDSTGGVAIPQPDAAKAVQIGDAVEVRGDAELRDFSSALHNANVRLLWSHTPVPPVSVTASQAATGAFDAQFIETEGRLVSQQRTDGRSVTLRLDEGSQSFIARAENPSTAETLRSLKIGSRLRLRGICVTDRTYTRDEIPFALLMRSVGDAEMVEPPPWWNTQHVVELVVGLLALSLGLQLIYTSVKRSRLRAVMEERERLALEMHDTLAQSFAGLGFQLEAISAEVEPGSSIRTRLESTVDLVRLGHLEARRNIAALRSDNLELMGLAKALEHAAHAIVQGGPITIQMSVRGEPKQIPLRINDTLFRIGQEAIANAVRHAQAHTIRLLVVYGRPSVKLTIRDDGIGFSSLGETAGFGIRGMKRRADRIAAAFRIRSSPGHGTSVSVRAILPQPLLSSWSLRTMRMGIWRKWRHGKAL